MPKKTKTLERVIDLATEESFKTPRLGRSYSTIFYDHGDGKYVIVLKRGRKQYIGCHINQQSEIPISDLKPRTLPHLAEADLAEYAFSKGWEEHKSGVELYQKLHQQEEEEIIEGEILPAESNGIPMFEIQKDNGVGFLADAAENWHHGSVLFGKSAIICAAMAGQKLNELKARCKHGEWQEVLKTMPFSTSTSKNYRKLADQMTAKSLEGGQEINLLELPDSPEKLADPIYAEQVDMVNAVTGEKTLRQLYFDWGIVKEAAKKALPTDGEKAPKLTAAQKKQLAEELVIGLQADLQKQLIEDRGRRNLLLLDKGLLKTLEADLISATLNVRELLK